jgi:hypothetical protein
MLEYVVRPFQAPDSHGRVIIHSTPKASTETAILTWGGEADLPDVVYYEQGFNTRKHREEYDEINRDTETVRITGTTDDTGNVWVDVERANRVVFDKIRYGGYWQPSSAGQVQSVNPTFSNPNISTNQSADPDKFKATMKLINNTTAAGG